MPAEDTLAHVISVVRGAVEDKFWRVRYQLADHITDLQAAIKLQITTQHLVNVYQQLVKSPEGDVREAATGKLKKFASALLANTRESIIMENLLPVVRELVGETNLQQGEYVGTSAAIVYPSVEDENLDVRLNIISNLECVNQIMGVTQLSHSLLPAIIELASDTKCRIRLAIIEYMPLLANQLGLQCFNDRVTNLCLGWLTDEVYAVRKAAVTNKRKLMDQFGIEWASTQAILRLIQLPDDSTYLRRTICLASLQELDEAESCRSELLPKHLLPTIIQLVRACWFRSHIT
ncbi:hypothetical protein PHET_08011 [Paragonimus heterotremus]|uniref:Phosphatase PP2A regulatory subunit A/Splicing factor 3B subunit 1-like HEAT repeat domain-containing protein n=1 Tax=Paragonimus heterotremus TaxID=100268 RepID=A0A8J4SVA3_9TREM|nr:hypothetical protein PHET_08011 [Paragonimus heterotremus]